MRNRARQVVAVKDIQVGGMTLSEVPCGWPDLAIPSSINPGFRTIADGDVWRNIAISLINRESR